MKKIVLLLLVSLIGISCSVSDDHVNYHYEVLPVESFELPESFKLGEIHYITLKYKRPNDCYVSPSLYFEKDEQIRTIAIQTLVANLNECATVPDEGTKELTFRFEVVSSTPYVFKFFKGKDENDQPVFESVTIPVNN